MTVLMVSFPGLVLRCKMAREEDQFFSYGDEVLVLFSMSNHVCKHSVILDLFDENRYVLGLVPWCCHPLGICHDVHCGRTAPLVEDSTKEIFKSLVWDTNKEVDELLTVCWVEFVLGNLNYCHVSICKHVK